MAQQRRKRRKVTPEMRRIIAEEAAEGASARMILKALDDAGHGGIQSERTIHDVVRELTPAPGRWWRLTDSEPEDAGLVFDVMAERARRSNYREWWVSRDEAEWIVRIRRSRPDFAPWLAYTLARMYVRRQQEPGSSEWDLTAEVAFPAEVYRKVAEQFGSFAWGRPLPEEVDDGKA